MHFQAAYAALIFLGSASALVVPNTPASGLKDKVESTLPVGGMHGQGVPVVGRAVNPPAPVEKALDHVHPGLPRAAPSTADVANAAAPAKAVVPNGVPPQAATDKVHKVDPTHKLPRHPVGPGDVTSKVSQTLSEAPVPIPPKVPRDNKVGPNLVTDRLAQTPAAPAAAVAKMVESKTPLSKVARGAKVGPEVVTDKLAQTPAAPAGAAAKMVESKTPLSKVARDAKVGPEIVIDKLAQTPAAPAGAAAKKAESKTPLSKIARDTKVGPQIVTDKLAQTPAAPAGEVAKKVQANAPLPRLARATKVGPNTVTDKASGKFPQKPAAPGAVAQTAGKADKNTPVADVAEQA